MASTVDYRHFTWQSATWIRYPC